ncbi:MAG: sulfite exporter TauE/SafE family protein [Proteobacteria bacterium]|nr:sulfite exporter TauE/SafE family protein [Pseudomonadota bacterium]
MIPYELLTPELGTAALIAAVAGTVRGFAGIGSGFIMIPLFSFLFGPAQAIVIVAILDGFGSAQLLPWALPRTNWRLIGTIAIATIIMMPVGVWALLSVDQDTARRIVGSVVVLSTLLIASGWRLRGGPTLGRSLGIGGLAGLLMGGTGMGGPPVIVYFLATLENSENIRANIISYFLLVVAFIVVAFAWSGVVTRDVLWQTVLLAPIFLAFLWLGSRLYPLASERLFRIVAYTLIFLSGGAAIIG